MKVSVITPAYNNPTLLRLFLQNLKVTGNWPDEVIIISDHSTTQLVDIQVAKAAGPNVKLVRMTEWSGHCKSINAGIAKATGDICLICDTDVTFFGPILETLKEDFENDEKISVVGAKLFYPNGLLQHAGAALDWFGDFVVYGDGQPEEDYPEARRPKFVECVTGAVYAFRRSLWEPLGKFDDGFKFFFGDPEYCYRSWKNGYKVLYEPAIEAIHARGGSRSTAPDQRFALAKAEDKARWEKMKIPYDWNSIFLKVWEANRELQPNYKQQIILERRGMLGDVIQFTSLVSRVRKAYPKAEIYVKTQKEFQDVFKGNQDINGISQAIEGPYARLVSFNVSNEAWLEKPMAWAHWKIATDAGLEIGPYTEEVPVMYSWNQDWASIAGKAGIFQGEKYAVLHQAKTHWKSKTLPYLTYAKITCGLQALGLRVIVIGTEKDYKAFGTATDLRGNHSIQEVRELIRHAAIFVGMDSAPANICQTTDTPGVVIFTSVRPVNILRREGMYPVEPTGCKGCLHRQKEITGHIDCPEGRQYECTKTVNPDDVIEMVKKIVPRYQANHINLSQDYEFRKRVAELIPENKIEEIIETGAYNGLGSTKVFAETGLPVTSIEGNPRNAETAAQNLTAFKNVTIVNALSLSLESMREHIMAGGFKTGEDVMHDTDAEGEMDFYMREISHPVPQNALLPIIDNDKRQMILLDSAGGVGILEVKKVLELTPERLKNKLLLLDDCDHVKHAESVKMLRGLGFEVNLSESKRFAWIRMEKK